MKKIFLIISFLMVSLFAVAQSDVKLGKPYRVIDAAQKLYHFSDNSVLTIKIKAESIFISRLNTTTLSQELTVENNPIPKGFSFEELTEIDNVIYLFYSVWDKKNETEQLFYQTINPKTCKLSGTEKLVLKVTSRLTGAPVALFNYFALGVKNKFSFNHSFDKSKTLITYRVKPEVKSDDKSYDVIGVNIFDNKLNPISLNEVKMPHTEKVMDNIDYTVDCDGNTFILTLVNQDLPGSKKNDKNYKIELLKIVPKSDKVTIIPVSLDGKHIDKLWMYEFDKNKIVCAGFYNKNANSDGANGVMFFNVNKDNSITNIVSHEIPLAILNQYSSKRAQRKNDKAEKDDKAEFASMEMKKLISQPDGSIILIGEQSYSVTTTYYTQSGSRTVTNYFYNDILVTKINADGTLAWMRKLPKRQQGPLSPGELSYKYIKGDKSHAFVFIDDEENVVLDVNDVPKVHVQGREGVLAVYQISDDNGSVKKVGILNTKDVQGTSLYQISMNRLLEIDNNEFVFESYKKGKEDILIKVKLK